MVATPRGKGRMSRGERRPGPDASSRWTWLSEVRPLNIPTDTRSPTNWGTIVSGEEHITGSCRRPTSLYGSGHSPFESFEFEIARSVNSDPNSLVGLTVGPNLSPPRLSRLQMVFGILINPGRTTFHIPWRAFWRFELPRGGTPNVFTSKIFRGKRACNLIRNILDF